jgi:hypothetical protein
MSTKILYAVLIALLLAMPLSIARHNGYEHPCGYGYFSYAYTYDCPPPGDGDDDPELPDLDVELVPLCLGSTITVTSDGDPVSGASVDVIQVNGPSIFSGTTDSNGEVTLDPDDCGLNVRIYADKSGYNDYDGDPVEIDCGVCAPPECPPGQELNEETQECEPIECGPCESLVGNQCVFQCTSGQNCENNQCVERPGCKSDLECDPDQECVNEDGTPGTPENPGSCKDLCADGSNFCQCSEAKDHELVPTGWECGSEAGCSACPNGLICEDHKCVPLTIECDEEAVVGEPVQCTTNCPKCKVLVEGEEYTTDENGKVTVTFKNRGLGEVQLAKGGATAQTQVNVKGPEGAPPPAPPTAPPGEGFNLLWLLILLALIILGIVYWRSRQKK